MNVRSPHAPPNSAALPSAWWLLTLWPHLARLGEACKVGCAEAVYCYCYTATLLLLLLLLLLLPSAHMRTSGREMRQSEPHPTGGAVTTDGALGGHQELGAPLLHTTQRPCRRPCAYCCCYN